MQPPRMHYVWGELGPFQDLNGKPGLTSAGVAWENPGDSFTAWVPDSDPLMVDSGGFQAATKWPDCEYPYSPRELFEWAEKIGADIVAGMDVACETRNILQDLNSCRIDPGPVEERVAKSLEYQIDQLRVYQKGLRNGDWSFEFMPVVQGYSVDQYRWFAREMRRYDLVEPLVGIGSVCKRDKKDQILRVANAVQNELPEWVNYHLFGATIRVWKDRRFWNLFESSDTAAWKFRAESKAHKCELLAEYMEKVTAWKQRIQRQQTLQPLKHDNYATVAAVARGNVTAMQRLSGTGGLQ